MRRKQVLVLCLVILMDERSCALLQSPAVFQLFLVYTEMCRLMMTTSQLIVLLAVCAAMCVALPAHQRTKRQAVDFEPDIVVLEEPMQQVSTAL